MSKYIEIILPTDAEGLIVHYQKVAEREGFDVERTEEILKQEITYENEINAENKDAIRIVDLEDGIYQIYVTGDEEYEFSPMLVSMPAWTTNSEQPEYGVSVTPKYTNFLKTKPEQTTFTEIPFLESPKTGDTNNSSVLGVLGVISFIIVVIMSCHNRFKCARMTE